jgi:hypothetical protein
MQKTAADAARQAQQLAHGLDHHRSRPLGDHAALAGGLLMAARSSGVSYGFQRVHAALQTGHALTVQQQRQSRCAALCSSPHWMALAERMYWR